MSNPDLSDLKPVAATLLVGFLLGVTATVSLYYWIVS